MRFHFRLPIVDEKAPSEADFDTILDVLKVEGPDTACVFNCQVIKKKELVILIIYSRLSRSFTARGSVKGGPPRV